MKCSLQKAQKLLIGGQHTGRGENKTEGECCDGSGKNRPGVGTETDVLAGIFS